jgi:Restriction endonuclease
MIDLYVRFERFAEHLFEALGHDIQTGRHEDYDFSFGTGPTATVVEVKLFRSQKTSTTILRNAVIRTAFARLTSRAARGILVTNLAIDANSRESLESSHSIEIFDYNILSGMVAGNITLQNEFEDILRESYTFHSGPLPTSETLSATHESETSILEPSLKELPSPPTKGTELSKNLRNIASGKPQATEFEATCTEALQYAFADDFVGWKKQASTNTSLHRFDLIARISSEEEFWQSLIQDFRTRYVIFEFKNYKDPIDQTQIFSTEKYLYPAAMRATAIIISREGADNNALSAARGALRESMKLILNISVDQLCSMLIRKDKGESPSDILATQLDEMLFRIER